MPTVSITVSGTNALIAKLEGLGDSLLDFSPELAATGEFLVQWFKSFPFASEGQIYGQSWARLSPTYEKYKAQKYRGRTILIASGKLQQSFYSKTGSGFVEIGNDATNEKGVNYFNFHQTGTRKMPARVSMILVQQNMDGIAAIFEAGVRQKLSAIDEL